MLDNIIKELFATRTLVLLILILSTINAVNAMLIGNDPAMWGWISSVAGWYAFWGTVKKD